MFAPKETDMTNISRHQQSIKRRDDTRIGRQHAGRGQQMKITMHALIATATAAATIGLAATAHADEIYDFLSPSGNIVCFVSTSFDGTNGAECEIRDYTYVAPPKPPGCQLGGWGDRFSLKQGSAPVVHCHGDTNFVHGLPILPYGQMRSAGPITCNSEASGVTCTDRSTGHFFRLSRESYQLG